MLPPSEALDPIREDWEPQCAEVGLTSPIHAGGSPDRDSELAPFSSGGGGATSSICFAPRTLSWAMKLSSRSELLLTSASLRAP